MEIAPTGRRISLADLHRAVEKLGISQAEIGVAVLHILAEPEELTPGMRKELTAKVEQSIEDLMAVVTKLMEAPPYGD